MKCIQVIILFSFHLLIVIEQVVSQAYVHFARGRQPPLQNSSNSGVAPVPLPRHDGTLLAHAGNEANIVEHVGFSEVELERLCPPGNLEVLKTIPRGIRCQSGDIDFWFKTCRCYYVKSLSCPPCSDNPLAAPSMQRPQGLPHLILSNSPAFNASMVYQTPNGGEEDNSTAGVFPTPNKFSIFNSAGGIVNLYFYNTGQQQVITSAIENELTNISTNQSIPNANPIFNHSSVFSPHKFASDQNEFA